MEFTTTERGQRKLIKDGFIYTFQKFLANDFASWECVLRRKGQCKAKVKLDPNDNFVEQTNQHTHPPSLINCEVAKVRAGIRRRAQDTVMTSQQILAEQLAGISEGAAINLPVVGNLRRNIRSARQLRNLPPLPNNIAEIPVLPNEFQTTTNGEQFLFFDSGAGNVNRIIAFASIQARQLLVESDNWYADGTFKVCPGVFYQLYTFHAQRAGRIFPCIFALLPNKTEITYRRLMDAISNLTNGRAPDDILIDFERGALNAINEVFPDTNVKGCFFHLCSNVWKHVQAAGLQVRYLEEPEFALQLRMLTALAFLPPQNVTAGFVSVCNEIRRNFGDAAEELLAYFEDTYIGRFRVDAARGNPLFSIELWNMFHRTDAELPRTNNSVEGWHRSFQGHVSSCHPNFWKFLQVLKNEESVIRVDIMQQLGGHVDPPRRARYVDCNTRIVRIVDDYPNRELIPYLRAIAHNLTL